MQLTLHTASIIVSSKIKRYGTIDYSISKILLSKPRRSPWLRHAATHLFLPPPYVIGHVFVYTPWLRVHPKTLIPSTYSMSHRQPRPLSLRLYFSIRRAKILSFHDPLGDRVAVLSFHGTGPDSTGKIHTGREGGRERGIFRNFLRSIDVIRCS